ncbi:MAG: hypothetical protein KJ077_10930 [Anaerolineae bacterium]|nr:hypothetical protein [Anaerolineae bacterium]
MVPPDVAEHVLVAKTVETGRLVKVAPFTIPPGERAPVSLPYMGRRASDYLAAALEGEAEWLTPADVNLTGAPILLYHGIWADTGNQAGWFYPEHLIFLNGGLNAQS